MDISLKIVSPMETLIDTKVSIVPLPGRKGAFQPALSGAAPTHQLNNTPLISSACFNQSVFPEGDC